MIFFLVLALILIGIYAIYTVVIAVLTVKNLGAKRPADFSDRYYLSPWELQVSFENIEFITTDNIHLYGWLMIPKEKSKKKRIIIIFCGRFGRKQDYLGIASGLVRAGLYVFIFDYRGRQRKDKIRISVGHYERFDAQAAVDKIREICREKKWEGSIGFLGYSLGGYLAIALASQNKDVQAVVTDCAFMSLPETIRYRYSFLFYWPPQLPFRLANRGTQILYNYSLEQIENYSSLEKFNKKTALYFIHNKKDKSVPPVHSQRMFDLATCKNKQLELVEEGSHCSSYFYDRPTYIAKVSQFFSRHIV